MKKILMRMLFVGVIAIYPQLFLNAQPPDGDPDGDPDAIPLDPGSWVLVAAGVGYGVKKWRDSKQDNSKNTHRISDVTQENEINKNF